MAPKNEGNNPCYSRAKHKLAVKSSHDQEGRQLSKNLEKGWGAGWNGLRTLMTGLPRGRRGDKARNSTELLTSQTAPSSIVCRARLRSSNLRQRERDGQLNTIIDSGSNVTGFGQQWHSQLLSKRAFVILMFQCFNSIDFLLFSRTNSPIKLQRPLQAPCQKDACITQHSLISIMPITFITPSFPFRCKNACKPEQKDQS